jgi:hypothetical protein
VAALNKLLAALSDEEKKAPYFELDEWLYGRQDGTEDRKILFGVWLIVYFKGFFEDFYSLNPITVVHVGAFNRFDGDISIFIKRCYAMPTWCRLYSKTLFCQSSSSGTIF